MKTNFPALLFVFLGVATFIYVTESEIRNPNTWKFEGELAFDEDIQHLKGTLDLSKGRVQIFPRFENSMIDREGVFTLFVNTPTDPKEYIRLLRYKLRVSDTCMLSADVTGDDLIRNTGQSRSFTVWATLRAQENAICD